MNAKERRFDSIRHAWRKAVKAIGLSDPRPRFHDLRDTGRGNARRSGIDPDIAEAILGHWNRGRRVNERYGWISDQELIAAIDGMTFDHGDTHTWAAGREKDQKDVRKPGSQKNIRTRALIPTS